MYAVQGASILVPLATLPYLSRVLGPAEFGRLAFFHALSLVLSVPLAYGFELGASREVARRRNDRTGIGQVASGVLGAQAALTAVTVALSWWAMPVIPGATGNTALFWGAIWLAAAQGITPTWFFIGVERMPRLATWLVGTRLAGGAAVFLAVRSPGDGWIVLHAHALFASVSVLALLHQVRRLCPLVTPSAGSMVSALRMGWSMFVFQGGVALYTSLNAVLLGLFSPATSVAYFAGADRVSRGLTRAILPLNQALMPRVSRHLAAGVAAAGALVSRSLLFMGAAGAGAGALLFVGAPTIVAKILGPGYEDAVPTLRLLAAIPVLVSVSNVLGIQWMVPLRRDRAFNTIILGAAGLNLAAAFVLVPRFSHTGIAIASVSAEAFVVCAMVTVLVRARLVPWRMAVATDAAGATALAKGDAA